jgi:hypothetical protein
LNQGKKTENGDVLRQFSTSKLALCFIYLLTFLSIQDSKRALRIFTIDFELVVKPPTQHTSFEF